MIAKKSLQLDEFSSVALRDALEAYVRGQGMRPDDGDAWMLQAIISDLWLL